jgi:LruC domain-containing protein
MTRILRGSVAVLLAAALIGCAGAGAGGAAGTDAATTEFVEGSVPRDGEFAFDGFFAVEVNLRVDLESQSGSGLQTASAHTSSVIATVADSDGNLLYRGRVPTGETLGADIMVPAELEAVSVAFDAAGYGEERIDIANVTNYARVNRQVTLQASGPPSPDDTRDSDGDEVPDVYDAYPNDARLAFERRIPATKTLTVAFEDNFPNPGDRDFNDFVATYAVHELRDTQNRLLSLDGTVTARARHAGFDHAFGIVVDELPSHEADLIVERFDHTGALIEQETRRVSRRADILVFPDTAAATAEDPGYTTTFLIDYINTGIPHPWSRDTWRAYDPYLIINPDSDGYDVHLLGESPLPDSTNPPGFESFRDPDTGYPWALLVPESWEHPAEGTAIGTAYPRFESWRESAGTSDTDWYLYPASGSGPR